MKVLKFAAIDIGSNAIRLLISYVRDDKEPEFNQINLVRVPVRLGSDAFVKRKISDQNTEKLINALMAFSYLIKVMDVDEYKAYGTSALREAVNGLEITGKVREKTDINIEIISGKQEADIIFSAGMFKEIESDKNYLYIDVGGGSTEITLFTGKKAGASESFNIGTIRLLNKLVTSTEWDRMTHWLSKETKELTGITAIGSGGNINKLHKMEGKGRQEPLLFSELIELRRFLDSFSYEERISNLGLKPDRADVIIPAADIFICIMKYCYIEQIFVPKAGLADGIIRQLYRDSK